MPDRIELRTARLSLRPFRSQDAAEIYAGITPALTRYMRWEPPASAAAFAVVWRSWLTAFQAGTDIHFVVRRQTGNEFCGLVGLHQIGETRPELGIWIKEAAQRSGFGTEALTAVARWASQHQAPEDFVYPVAEENKPSRRLAEALGGAVIDRREGGKYSSVIYHIPALLADATSN